MFPVSLTVKSVPRLASWKDAGDCKGKWSSKSFIMNSMNWELGGGGDEEKGPSGS